MKRIKILIVLGAFVAATATTTGNVVLKEQSADGKNVETLTDVKNKPDKKGICWKSIRMTKKEGKTVMYCGTCTQLSGKRAWYSLPGRTGKFSQKHHLAGVN